MSIINEVNKLEVTKMTDDTSDHNTVFIGSRPFMK